MALEAVCLCEILLKFKDVCDRQRPQASLCIDRGRQFFREIKRSYILQR